MLFAIVTHYSKTRGVSNSWAIWLQSLFWWICINAEQLKRRLVPLRTAIATIRSFWEGRIIAFSTTARCFVTLKFDFRAIPLILAKALRWFHRDLFPLGSTINASEGICKFPKSHNTLSNDNGDGNPQEEQCSADMEGVACRWYHWIIVYCGIDETCWRNWVL